MLGKQKGGRFTLPEALEPVARVELATCCLRNSCSTTELHRQTSQNPQFYCSIAAYRVQPSTLRLQALDIRCAIGFALTGEAKSEYYYAIMV